ncbi:uncharacterized protein LOC135137806 isoform X2 [Zophobas morio]|uniref:uncharacterized protein LOC135137806 isoform X2 n=1 Tax=Zophobas morio TaxID=2755281 RepID=UPI003082F8DA
MNILKQNKMVLFLLIISSVFLFGIRALEDETIITRLVNTTHIYCVGDKNVNSAISTYPPLVELQHAENLLESGTWENDDWITKDSSNIISPVTDKRWEDFGLIKSNYFYFTNATSAIFSLYGAENIEIFGDDGESLDYVKQSLNNTEEWNTFTIFFKDNYINYFINNNHIRRHPLKPTHLALKTEEEAYFKMHNYKYKEATDVTNTRSGPTSLKIPPVSNSALILYISLCRSCVLEVEYDGKIKNIPSHIKETTDVFDEWQEFKININSSKTSQVNFTRKKNNQTEDGYWRLDARLYNNEYNVVAYNIPNDIKPEDVRCKYLQPSNTEKPNRAKRRANPSDSSTDDIAKCLLGMADKCDISCASILGDRYSQCQGHKICDVEGCKCHPCYTGDWCNKRDDTESVCQVHHESFLDDTIKGAKQDLSKQFSTNFFTGVTGGWMSWSNIILWAVVLSVIIIEGARRIKNRYTRLSTLSVEDGEAEEQLSASNMSYTDNSNKTSTDSVCNFNLRLK